MANDPSDLRFPGVLRAARQRARLSYRQLAAASGVSHSLLSHVEKGERRAPRMDRVVSIARALDAVTPSFLVAALADRAGDDVVRLFASLLRPRPEGHPGQGDVDGVSVEEGTADDLAGLQRVASSATAVDALRRRLYFVDLQFDPEILRVGFSAEKDGGRTILGVIGSTAPGPTVPASDESASDDESRSPEHV